MSDWGIPGDPISNAADAFAPDAWPPTVDAMGGNLTDPFAEEIADVGGEWDADLLWGPDPAPDAGGDLDLPL